MSYYNLSYKKNTFLVTPSELRALLEDFHHVSVNGVDFDYVESDPEKLFSNYETLYHALKNGEKLVWKQCWRMVGNIRTGITRHLENCTYILYRPDAERLIPQFAEPCPYLDVFSFTPWKDQLSTAFDYYQNPENICGLRIFYPSRCEYPEDTPRRPAGIVEYTCFDDYPAYLQLLERIKKRTRPLRLEWGGRIHRTPVRISPEAKKDLENFWFITSNSVTVL